MKKTWKRRGVSLVISWDSFEFESSSVGNIDISWCGHIFAIENHVGPPEVSHTAVSCQLLIAPCSFHSCVLRSFSHRRTYPFKSLVHDWMNPCEIECSSGCLLCYPWRSTPLSWNGGESSTAGLWNFDMWITVFILHGLAFESLDFVKHFTIKIFIIELLSYLYG